MQFRRVVMTFTIIHLPTAANLLKAGERGEGLTSIHGYFFVTNTTYPRVRFRSAIHGGFWFIC